MRRPHKTASKASLLRAQFAGTQILVVNITSATFCVGPIPFQAEDAGASGADERGSGTPVRNLY